MAEVVDSIVAQLEARLGDYVTNFNAAADAHERFTRTRPDRVGQFSPQQVEQYANRHKTAAADVAQAEEQTTARVTRTCRKRVDDSIALDRRETDAAKRAAKERADAEIAEAQRSARLSEIARRGAERANAGVPRATNSTLGRTVPREASGQRGIPAAALTGGAEEVAAAKEVNRLNVDLLDLKDKQGLASAKDARLLGEKIAELRYIKSLEREGVDQAEIALKLDERRALVAAKLARDDRATAKHGGGMSEANQFALSATGGRFGYSFGAGAVAGIAGAAIAGSVVSLAKQGLEYARSLQVVSQELGLTTRDLQLYQVAASDAGVSSDQLKSALSQLANNLGRAQEGAQEQRKLFSRLNIDIGNQREGLKSLSDILPALQSRLSKIPDQQRRLAIETVLGGDALRKLDPILSQGRENFDRWAASVEEAGGILSSSQIQQADRTAVKIQRMQDQLNRDVASTVANNASAIEQLATAFLRAADAALKFFGAMARQGNLDIINSPSTVRAANAVARRFGLTDKTPQDVQRQAITDLLNDPEGRKALLRRNSNQLAAVRQAAGQEGVFSTFQIAGEHVIQNTASGRADARRRLLVDRRRILEAGRAAEAPSLPPSTGGVGTGAGLFSPDAAKPRGKSAHKLQDETERRADRQRAMLERYEDERLRAVQQQTADEEERRDIDRRQIDRDLAREKLDLQAEARAQVRDGADARTTTAWLARAEAAAEAAAGERAQVINLDSLLASLNRRAATATAALDLDDEILRDQLATATTIAERRRIELQLLENARKRETVAANLVFSRAENGDPTITRQDINDANRTLATQDARFGSAARATARNNESPLESYRRQLHEATDDTNEALERIQVSGLQRLEDEVANTASSVLGLKGAFGDLVSSILVDLARLEIKKGILSLFRGGGGGDDALGALIRTGANAALGIPGLATGGSFVVGGNGGIDRNLMSINGQPVARVNRGERVAVIPPDLGRINPPAITTVAPQVTVMAPLQVDLSNAVMTPELAEQFNQVSLAHSKWARDSAVGIALKGAPGYLRQTQVLGPK